MAQVTESRSKLERLFEARSIALVGVSHDMRKASHQAFKTLIQSGYRGKIYPINVKTDRILDSIPVRSLDEIPAPVDLVMTFLPADLTHDVIARLVGRQDSFLVVYSSGFAEAGSHGEEAQRNIIQILADSRLRLLGPNSMGIFNAEKSLNLTGRDIPAGPIGVISQSGNIFLSLLEDARHFDIGFSKFAALGNQADLNSADLLDYFVDDPETKVIVLYVESIPAGQGAEFRRTLSYAAYRKPVVVLKGGVTSSGQRAARSHTASLAGDARIFSAMLRQSGAIEVSHLEELLPVAESLFRCPPLRGSRIAVIGSGGGHSILCTDALERSGLRVPPFSPKTREKIAEKLPSWTAVGNPVDIASEFHENLELLNTIVELSLNGEDPCDGALVYGLYGQDNGTNDAPTHNAFCSDKSHTFIAPQPPGKPIILYTPYAKNKSDTLTRLRKSGVPCFDSLSVATKCLSALQSIATLNPHPHHKQSALTAHCKHSEHIPSIAWQRPHRNVTEAESYRLLAAHGIPVIEHIFIQNQNDMKRLAQDIAFPAVLKLVSSDVSHKTDAGGVVTGIRDTDDLVAAVSNITSRVETNQSAVSIDGYLVMPQLPTDIELLVGMIRDAICGQVIVIGAGGILAEFLDDIAVLIPPFDSDDVRSALSALRGHSRLTKAHDRSVDLAELTRLALDLVQLSYCHPEIAELDLNPVLLGPQGLVCADAHMLLE